MPRVKRAKHGRTPVPTSQPKRDRRTQVDMRADFKSLMPPVAAATLFKSYGGLADTTIDVTAAVATVYVGNGTLGNTDQVYFRNLIPGVSVTTAAVNNVFPIALEDWLNPNSPNSGGYGSPYAYDIMKYFRFKRFERLGLTIEPYGGGAGTGGAGSFAIAPISGGNVSVVGQSAVGTLTPLNVFDVRGAKGAREGPFFAPMDIDLMPFVALAGSKGRDARFAILQRGETETGGFAVTGPGVPAFIAISGINGTVTALRGSSIATVTCTARIRLEDFIGGLAPALGASIEARRGVTLRSDEKELPPRSVLADRGQNLSPKEDGWVIPYDPLRRLPLVRQDGAPRDVKRVDEPPDDKSRRP